MDTLTITHQGPIATIMLNRPDVHNAFNPALIDGLHSVFTDLAAQIEQVRVVVLAGAGRSFCAGADLGWMRDSMGWSEAENLADAERLAALFAAAAALPQPLVGRVQGVALGGGAGLVACCDIAVAEEGAQMGFSEVRLGLVPAVIAQHVAPKIGLGHTRALFVSGERIGAQRARELGLVHHVVPAADLDATVGRVVAELLQCGPRAIAVTKLLLRALPALPADEARRYLAETIAAVRTGPEAQEGLRAFVEKRAPAWRASDEERGTRNEE